MPSLLASVTLTETNFRIELSIRARVCLPGFLCFPFPSRLPLARPSTPLIIRERGKRQDSHFPYNSSAFLSSPRALPLPASCRPLVFPFRKQTEFFGINEFAENSFETVTCNRPEPESFTNEIFVRRFEMRVPSDKTLHCNFPDNFPNMSG